MISFGSNLAIAMYLIAMIAFINSSNLVTLVICLELLLLSVGILLVNLSFHLDDLVGSCLCLYILPLAGAESAVALAVLVAFYPLSGTILFSVLCSTSLLLPAFGVNLVVLMVTGVTLAMHYTGNTLLAFQNAEHN